jgi:hypothetical protein
VLGQKKEIEVYAYGVTEVCFTENGHKFHVFIVLYVVWRITNEKDVEDGGNSLTVVVPRYVP